MESLLTCNQISPSKPKEAMVQITRLEGKSDLCGITHRFESLKDAQKWLDSVAQSFPKEGYDKVRFVIDFGNDDIYTGNLDCKHPENQLYRSESNSLTESPINYMKFLIEKEAEYNCTPQCEYFLNLFKEVIGNESY